MRHPIYTPLELQKIPVQVRPARRIFEFRCDWICNRVAWEGRARVLATFAFRELLALLVGQADSFGACESGASVSMAFAPLRETECCKCARARSSSHLDAHARRCPSQLGDVHHFGVCRFVGTDSGLSVGMAAFKCGIQKHGCSAYSHSGVRYHATLGQSCCWPHVL